MHKEVITEYIERLVANGPVSINLIGDLIRQTNLVTSDNIPEIEKMEEVMGPTLEKWPALLPIAPLPKKPEEYEFKVYGDESYKQQIAKLKENKIGDMDGTGVMEQILKNNTPQNHIIEVTLVTRGESMTFQQHLNNLVHLELSGINLHGKLSALRYMQNIR